MRTVALAAVILSGQLFAAQNPSRFPARLTSYPLRVPEAESVTKHSYDVINYNLYMDWYDVLLKRSAGYDGKLEITFTPSLTAPLNSIQLNDSTTYLVADSAFEGTTRLNISGSGGELTVALSTPLQANQIGNVVIYFHVTDPGIAPNPDSLQRGLYVYYSPAVPHTVAYTMSEPSDARCWMPCYDDPSDKALCEIAVRVPNGFVAASNGTLDSTIDNKDSSTTFYWSEAHPISTYLMCATAAKFSVIKDSVKINGKTIPLEYYVYPEDSVGALHNGECNIDTVASMMRFFSSIYGDYPFEKYGMTGIEPFKYGGMEHATITTLNRNYEFTRRDVSHELAHQWWGDMVTLGTWKDIWLNEGFATYSEAMQLQHLSEISFEYEMLFYASRFFAEDSTQLRYAMYDPPPAYIFGLVEYYKGAWVLHMLRNIVGDSTFFNIFRRYRSDYEYGNAVTADFESVVDSLTGSDMSWFFNEWVFDAGYPVYSESFSQIGDTVSVSVRQIQSDTTTYKMPMEIQLFVGGNGTVKTVWDSLRMQSFKFPVSGNVDSVKLDPNNKILARYPGQALTQVEEGGTTPVNYSLLQSYPNPFNGMTNVVYNLPSSAVVTLELYDILGRKVETLLHGYQSSGMHEISVNASRLSSGVYICRLTTPVHRMTAKLVLEK